MLRGAGDTLTSESLVLRFDPEIVAVTRARPILMVNGVIDAQVDRGSVVIQLPAGTPLEGTRAIVEVTVVGVKPGRATLSVDGSGASAAVEVR